jgi:hypothetical protein
MDTTPSRGFQATVFVLIALPCMFFGGYAADLLFIRGGTTANEAVKLYGAGAGVIIGMMIVQLILWKGPMVVIQDITDRVSSRG